MPRKRKDPAALLAKDPAAVALGRRGGKTITVVKSLASRANGARGGRPRKYPDPMYDRIREHVGHAIVAVAYGESNNPENVAVECADCHVVIIDADRFEEPIA